MNKRPLIIGNAQAFWGDSPGAAAQLIQKQPDLNFLTLDYLAEVSLSIMAIQKDKDPSLGYAPDFIEVVKSLIPFWKKGLKFKIVTNAGGLNPEKCAETCLKVLQEEQCSKSIGIVHGDDVLESLKKDPTNQFFANLETTKALSTILPNLVTANAYLGADGIAELLTKGADLVITGRVADPSLTVGPCLAHFSWSSTDYDKIAGATIAGHLIECGTQATGGFCSHWMELKKTDQLGFPFVILEEDGSFVITKPKGTGGEVSIETVKEQLLYEIGDPDNYLSPDVSVSFLSLKLEKTKTNHIRVVDAKGKAPPPTYKVSATYRDGFRADGFLTLFGHHAAEKAKRTGQILFKKLEGVNAKPEKALIECLGTGDSVPGVFSNTHLSELKECVLRVAVFDHKKEIVERFTKEIAPLITSGPQGITGYTAGRPKVRPVFSYWPCLIPRSNVSQKTTLLTGFQK